MKCILHHDQPLKDLKGIYLSQNNQLEYDLYIYKKKDYLYKKVSGLIKTVY